MWWIVSVYCEEVVNILRKYLLVFEKMIIIEDVMKSKVCEIVGFFGFLMEYCCKYVRKMFGSGGNIYDKIKFFKLLIVL